MKRIEESIKQDQFESHHHKAVLNVLYTASCFQLHINKFLKPFGLTHQQFNVLRILRGQKGQPISLKEVTSRMLDQSSNTSRIIERLRAKQLIERRECALDRRAVDLVITQEGQDLLQQIDQAGLIGHLQLALSHEEAELLNSLLDRMRVNL